MKMAPALFRREGDRYLPTDRTQGPWEVGFQFGGAPAALIAHVAEGVPTLVPLMVARLSVDLMRPVPMRPLEVVSAVRREGKKIQLVEVSIVADGVEVVRATVLRLRQIDLTDVSLPGGEPRLGPPAVPHYEHLAPPTAAVPDATRGTLDYALHPGDRIFRDATWARLSVPVVEGTRLSPIENMAYVADACSGFGHPREADLAGVNADITLNVIRPVEGDWLCCEGDGWTSHGGVGMAQVRMSDCVGVVGGATLSRLVDPR